MQLKEGDRVIVKCGSKHYSGCQGVIQRCIPFDKADVLLDDDENGGVPTIFALEDLERTDGTLRPVLAFIKGQRVKVKQGHPRKGTTGIIARAIPPDRVEVQCDGCALPAIFALEDLEKTGEIIPKSKPKKFNKGDRVQVRTRGASYFNGLYGVATNASNFAGVAITVSFDADPTLTEKYHSFEEEELIREFKKGDKVRIGVTKYADKTGKIVRRASGNANAWCVRVDILECPIVVIPYHNLDFLGPEKKGATDAMEKTEETPIIFKLGDRVRVHLTTNPYLDGQYGVVRSDTRGQDCLAVQFDIDPTDTKTYRYFKAEELVKEFKIGDHVRIGDISRCKGATGKIERHISNKSETWDVRVDTLKPPHPVLALSYHNLEFLGPDGVALKRENAVAETEKLLKKIEVEKQVKVARTYGMSEASEYFKEKIMADLGVPKEFLGSSPNERKRTVSATLVLASGLEVRIPDPNEEDWVHTKTVKVEGIHDFSVGMDAFGYYFSGQLPEDVVLRHDEAKCWMKDMCRIVEKRVQKGPFDVHYAYVTELRFFEKRVIEAEFEEAASYPTLRAYLW